MSDNDLRQFTESALARYDRPAEPDDLEDDELEEDEDQEVETEADETPGAPAGWDRWVASLSRSDLEIARADSKWAEYQFGLWELREDAKATFEKANHPDGSDTGDAPAEIAPQTGGEVVDWVYAHAAEIRRDHGVGPAEYLASIAGASRADWSRFANEAGIPLSAKPSYSQLPLGAQAAVVRADVAGWGPEDFRR